MTLLNKIFTVLLVALVMLGALGLLVAFNLDRQSVEDDRFPLIITAPDFKHEALNGSTFQLSDHLGKVVILDLMGTWCVPCEQGAEEILLLLNDPSLEIVVVSMSIYPLDTPEVLSEWVEERGMANVDNWYWFAFGNDSLDLADQLFDMKNSYLPKISLVDSNGDIRIRETGRETAQTLKNWVLQYQL